MSKVSHSYDVEARDRDKSRDPLGAGNPLAASFGAAATTGLASGPRGLVRPRGGSLVPEQGPRESGEREGLENQIAKQAGGLVTPPAKHHLRLRTPAQVVDTAGDWVAECHAQTPGVWRRHRVQSDSAGSYR